MPGFVFLSRKVELLGVKIIFLRLELPACHQIFAKYSKTFTSTSKKIFTCLS